MFHALVENIVSEARKQSVQNLSTKDLDPKLLSKPASYCFRWKEVRHVNECQAEEKLRATKGVFEN